MGTFVAALLDLALAAFGKVIDRFFKSERGKRVKGYMGPAARIVAIVASRTETKVDDAVVAIATELSLPETNVEKLLTGPWGDIIKGLVAARLLKEETGASDSESNLAVEFVLNQAKETSEG
ncbi:hypothetical protein LCGC14_3003780 [marine sediment metagenome]|uniref:Uncharacterized protein n=1 Tax=marine sediment metagenome TaxID=412755 RepID=A0A0F8X078_9ZZZZ